MENNKRQEIIGQIAELDVAIAGYELELKKVLPNPIPPNINELRTELQNARNKLKQKKMGLECKLDAMLPVTIEGFLGQDEEQVDQNEHGTVNEIYYFLGCPNLEETRWREKVKYDRQQDISEILKANEGKLMRVTIEAVELGDGGQVSDLS